MYLTRVFSASVLSGVAASIFGLWVVYQLLSGQPNYSADVFRSASRVHGAYALLFICYGAWLLLKRRLPSALPIDASIALGGVALLISSVFSVNPGVSLEASLLSFAPFVALYAIHDVAFLTSGRLIRVLLIGAALMAVLGIVGAAADYVSWLRLVKDVDGSIGLGDLNPVLMPRSGGVLHPNVLAMIINLALPFALIALLRARSTRDRATYLAVLCLLCFALFFTLSRGGWIASLAAISTLALLLTLGMKAGVGTTLTRLPVRRIAFAGLVGGVVFVGVAAAAWESRPGWLFRDTVSLRQEALSVGADMVVDRPFFGSGSNTYGLLYDAYGGQHAVDNGHPHNAYLSVLVDTGVIGAMLLLVAIGLFLVWLVRTYASAEPERRVTLAACCAALVTLPVHGLVDSPQLWNQVLLGVVIVLAIALRQVSTRLPDRTMASFGSARVLVAGMLPLLLAGWLYFDLSHARYEESIDLLASGSLEEAAAVVPDGSVAYKLQAGIAHGLLYQQHDDVAALDEAVESFQAAVKADPHSSVGFANLAQVLMLRGDMAGAVAAAAGAIAKGPTDAAVAVVAGVVYEAAGERTRAVEAYSRAVELDARLSQSQFWESSATRAAMRDEVIAGSGLNACQLGSAFVFYSPTMAGLEDLSAGCAAYVADNPSNAGSRAILAILMYAGGRFDEALPEARMARDAQPAAPLTHLALGIALSASGDLQAVRHELMLSAAMNGDEGRLLLAATYEAATGSRQVSPVLSILAGPDPMPNSVRQLRDEAFARFAETGGGRNYSVQRGYFRKELMRNAPSVIILPGDWQQLFAPAKDRFSGELAGTSPR